MNIVRTATRILRDLKHPVRAVDSMLWTRKARASQLFRDEIIIDVGMHEGQDTAFYLKKGFRVVAVEANPTLVAAAEKRFAPFIRKGQLTIVNVGIAESGTDEGLEFFVNERISEWSSFYRDVAARNDSPVHSVVVPTRTLASIVAQYGHPYCVKIDIEGFDRIALESLLSVAGKPRYISVENGHQGMLAMLVAAGYDRFKYVRQNNLSELRLERPAREGEYVGHLFPRGASGPFGEEAPGHWQTADEVRTAIAVIWDVDGSAKRAGHDDGVHGWFDLHARIADAPSGAG